MKSTMLKSKKNIHEYIEIEITGKNKYFAAYDALILRPSAEEEGKLIMNNQRCIKHPGQALCCNERLF